MPPGKAAFEAKLDVTSVKPLRAVSTFVTSSEPIDSEYVQ